MAKTLDRKIAHINRKLIKRDQLTFKILSAKSTLSSQFSAVSYVYNELALYNALKDSAISKAVQDIDNTTDPVSIGRINALFAQI